MKGITCYVKFSLPVADSSSFSRSCTADESFSNRWKAHISDIPKKWLTVSQPVRE